MPKPPTRQCDECRHFSTDLMEGLDTDQICQKNHRPHFFNPTSPVDVFYGWKRKCEDFVDLERKTILKEMP